MASLNLRTGVLGTRLAAHLLRRTSYNINKARIDSFATMTADEAVDYLIDTPADMVYPEPIDPETGEYFINCGSMPPSCTPGVYPSAAPQLLQAWWLYNALTDTSAHHKIQFFLHTCFTADIQANNFYRGFDYLQKLGLYTSGSYKELAKTMTIDSLMLLYLNGHENTVTSPNENYAREFFELFTIGKGPQDGPDSYTNYTEGDITAASKVFSGWRAGNRTTTIDFDLNVPVGYPVYSFHDSTTKLFSSKFGSTMIFGASDANDMHREMQDLIDLVFNQDETARHICRKMYRYFVNDHINEEIETDIIEPLASTLKDNDYNLGITLKQLFKSQHFFDEDDSMSNDETVGSKLKDPVTLILQTLSLTHQPEFDPITEYLPLYTYFLRNRIILFLFPYMGMSPFRPPSVAGYPADYQEPGYSKLWFDGSTVIARYNFGEMLLTDTRVILSGNFGGVKFDPVPFIEEVISDTYNAETIVNEICNYFLSEMPSADRLDYLLNTVFLDGLPAYDWTYEWGLFQISGNDTEVQLMLSRFFKTLFYTGEYQLM